MPTRGAPGFAAAKPSTTLKTKRTSRSVPQRRVERFGTRWRTGSHVKKCSPSPGSLTPPTSRPAPGSPTPIERRQAISGSGVGGCQPTGSPIPGSTYAQAGPARPSASSERITAGRTERDYGRDRGSGPGLRQGLRPYLMHAGRAPHGGRGRRACSGERRGGMARRRRALRGRPADPRAAPRRFLEPRTSSSSAASTATSARVAERASRSPAAVPTLASTSTSSPTSNPDGAASGNPPQRAGVDLNRNFPSIGARRARAAIPNTPARDPSRSRKARLAARLIRALRPKVTIWFHQHRADRPLVRAWGPSLPRRRPLRPSRWMPFRLIPWPPGTAPNWQNQPLPRHRVLRRRAAAGRSVRPRLPGTERSRLLRQAGELGACWPASRAPKARKRAVPQG